jgi:hypothetical protein
VTDEQLSWTVAMNEHTEPTITGFHPEVAALKLSAVTSVPLTFPNGDVIGEVDLHPDGTMTTQVRSEVIGDRLIAELAAATFNVSIDKIIVDERHRNG